MTDDSSSVESFAFLLLHAMRALVGGSFGMFDGDVPLDGQMRDWETEFDQGIENNLEPLAMGANIWGRSKNDPQYARDEFTGTISGFTIYGTQLSKGLGRLYGSSRG